MASSSSCPNMSYFATSLIALLAFHVIFNPFLAVNAQSLETGAIVRGLLTCPGSSPAISIPNTTVYLSCTTGSGSNVVLGQALTGVNGVFNMRVPGLGVPGDYLNNIQSLCNATVPFPLPDQTACPGLRTTDGVMVATLQPVNTVLAATSNITQLFNSNITQLFEEFFSYGFAIEPVLAPIVTVIR